MSCRLVLLKLIKQSLSDKKRHIILRSEIFVRRQLRVMDIKIPGYIYVLFFFKACGFFW